MSFNLFIPIKDGASLMCSLGCWEIRYMAHTPSLSWLPSCGGWSCSVTDSSAMFVRTKLGIEHAGWFLIFCFTLYSAIFTIAFEIIIKQIVQCQITLLHSEHILFCKSHRKGNKIYIIIDNKQSQWNSTLRPFSFFLSFLNLNWGYVYLF